MEMERIVKAMNEITHDAMSHTEQSALARILNAYFEGTVGKCQNSKDCVIRESNYRGAVDFLWMSGKISNTMKFDLLDLLG